MHPERTGSLPSAEELNRHRDHYANIVWGTLLQAEDKGLLRRPPGIERGLAYRLLPDGREITVNGDTMLSVVGMPLGQRDLKLEMFWWGHSPQAPKISYERQRLYGEHPWSEFTVGGVKPIQEWGMDYTAETGKARHLFHRLLGLPDLVELETLLYEAKPVKFLPTHVLGLCMGQGLASRK